VLLSELGAARGVVALCGLGVEVDAFVRGAPEQLGSTAWTEVVVVEQRPLPTARIAEVGAAFGCPASQAQEVPSHVAAIVRSPGFLVPAAVASAVPTTNPAALWLAERSSSGAETVGVTGTKGKSSVTTLLAEELGRRGRDVFLGGNVGTALWERPPTTPAVTVAELSSYQAIELDHSPDLGAITLLDDDHLDLHRTIEAYHQAKLNVVCGAARAARAAVVPEVDVELVRRRCGALPLRTVPTDVDVRRGNARVAAELLVLLGEEDQVDAALVASLVERYPDLPGRFHELSQAGDAVRWVDDALASNAAALVAAVHRARVEHAERRLVFVVGGRDERGVATGPVVGLLAGADDVGVVCLSEFGARLASDLRAAGTRPEVAEADGLEQALDVAIAWAGPGPATIVFSPGAPTPLNEGSWKDRSARFRRVALGQGVG
jgi:UDP-N-acetylmuramoylalanine-D-glutamate ligase